jgi:hypothetical protein
MLLSHVARRSGIWVSGRPKHRRFLERKEGSLMMLNLTGLRSAKEGVKSMQKMRPRHSKEEWVGRALERDIYQYFSAPFPGLLISPKLCTCLPTRLTTEIMPPTDVVPNRLPLHDRQRPLPAARAVQRPNYSPTRTRTTNTYSSSSSTSPDGAVLALKNGYLQHYLAETRPGKKTQLSWLTEMAHTMAHIRGQSCWRMTEKKKG